SCGGRPQKFRPRNPRCPYGQARKRNQRDGAQVKEREAHRQAETGQRVESPPPHRRLACRIWSKMPPLSKWVFCAFFQPPKISSTVKQFIFGKALAYFFSTASMRGRKLCLAAISCPCSV